MSSLTGKWFFYLICRLAVTSSVVDEPDRRLRVEVSPAAPSAKELTPRRGRIALHVATYNIEYGYRVPGAAKRITAFFGGLKPDIVCLQETHWRRSTPNLASGHPVAIAKTLGDYVWCGVDRGQPTRGTHSGMAIVTRGRILYHESLKVDHESPYGVLAEIEIDGVRLIIVSVHLRSLNGATIRGALSTEAARIRQVDHLVNRLKRETLPVIVAGDFNALPFFPSHGVIARKLRDVALAMRDMAFTRKTLGLPARIDYIFASDHFAIDRYTVHPVDYSDHRPVAAHLTLLSSEDSD